MQRTIRFPLFPTQEQQTILFETMQQYTTCFNKIAAYGWERGEKNGVELHKATYYPLRADYPQLPAQLVISARAKATEAVKSVLTWKIKREKEYPKKVAKAFARGKPVPPFQPVRCPQSNLSTIRYDQRSHTVYGACVSLATTQGRQVLALKLYPYAVCLLEQSIGFDGADLIYRKGKLWLHLVVTLPDVEFVSHGDVVGLDFGITRPAVAPNNNLEEPHVT